MQPIINKNPTDGPKAGVANSDSSVAASSSAHETAAAALHQDSWGDLLNTTKNLWHNLFDDDRKQATSITDVNSLGSGSLTFGDIFAVSKSQAESADTFSKKEPVGDTSAPLGRENGWFSEVNKKIDDAVGGIFDWFKTSSSSDGSQRVVSAKSGTVTYDGSTSSGVKVTVSDSQLQIHADVNGVEIDQNKFGVKETHYQGFELTGENKDGTQMVKSKDGSEVDWDAKKNHGEYRDADGKIVFEFGSLKEGQVKLDHYIKYHLRQGASLTQLDKGSASAAANQELHDIQRNNGADPCETKMFVDKDGDYAVVRKDGMIIKTFKNGIVEFDKFDKESDEVSRLQIRTGEDGRRHAYSEDPKTHQFTHKIDLRSHHPTLPKGLTLGEDATVRIDGQQVVSTDGVVHDGHTEIKVTSGTMTTSSDKGTVTVYAGNGRSTVDNPDAGKITSDSEGKFTNSDSHASFDSWDSQHGVVCAFQQSNGSGAELGAQGLRVRESDGQVTDLGNNGTVASFNSNGVDLFNIDSQGSVGLFDGTTIGADGHVFDCNGDDYGYGWTQNADATENAEEAENIIQESTTDSAISQSSTAINAVSSDFSGGSAVGSSEVGDLLSADGVLSQAEGTLDLNDVGLMSAISSQRSTLASMLAQAQTLSALDADLKGHGLSDNEVADAQKGFHNKTKDFAEQEAEERHYGNLT